MLSPEELKSLQRMLEKPDSFDSKATAFSSIFSKTDCFRGACGVYLLLVHGGITNPQQRLSAIFILYSLYRDEPITSNPFLPFFIDRMQNSDYGPLERDFVNELVLAPNNLSPMTTKEFVQKLEKGHGTLQVELGNLIAAVNERASPSLSGFDRIGVLPPVINDPEKCWTTHNSEESGKGEPQKSPEDARNEVLRHLLNTNSFKPQYIRPPPPVLTPTIDEVIWLNPEEECTLLWDPTMGPNVTGPSELQDYMQNAFSETLSEEKAEFIKSTLEKEPRLIHYTGLTPEKMSPLVENNPTIAIEALLHLTSSHQIKEYWDALLHMPMTVHSMEVVNKLTTAVNLPSEFLHQYICNFISYCDSIKDKHMQIRMVRLVCVFLQSLIRNEILNMNDLFAVVQTFCLEHIKTREAASLFRLLKSIEQNPQALNT